MEGGFPMDERYVGQNIALLRREAGMTQEELADRLFVSAQAVSKWENGKSLPETALLPALATLFDVSIDSLFSEGALSILEAQFGDGIGSVNVTGRLRRLVEDGELHVAATAALLGVAEGERASLLTVRYQTKSGVCLRAYPEGAEVSLSSCDRPEPLSEGMRTVAGVYGTKKHHCDVMQKMEHYKPFRWDAYRADHEVFPSDPANDGTEYLTLAYENADGVFLATCAEGESLAYDEARTKLVRRERTGERFLPRVPRMPPFGAGMECSWAAALTCALRAMGAETDYTEVMGVSGACFRLAFCSPGWDYSSVDGLVAYDYATPGYAAFGYGPEMHGRVEKQERAGHRARILREIRSGMPVLGINLRVAPEWGVICGYRAEGEVLFCRTKYDRPTIENDPAFRAGHPLFRREWLGPDETLQVDNWPFLLCYFTGKRNPPPPEENLMNSLRVFADCAAREREGGYFMGFKAYEVWGSDLLDDAFYESCDDEAFARRFSVDQFCALALDDARCAARDYLAQAGQSALSGLFTEIAARAGAIRRMLDSGEPLAGERCRAFWTREMRHEQAKLLGEMESLEREAHAAAARIIR